MLRPMHRVAWSSYRRLLLLVGWVFVGCGDDDGGVDQSIITAPPDASEPGTMPDPSMPPDASIEPPGPDGEGGGDGGTDTGGPCDPPVGPPPALKLTPIATGLNEPLYIAAAPGDDSRLFIVEQAGVIRILQDGQLLPEPFLDISARVIEFHSEDGLLGLAFHPDYANNGRFFVHYSTEQVGQPPGGPGLDAGADAGLDGGAAEASADAGDGLFIPSSSSVISEFRRGDDADHALASSERRLLVVEQFFFNHNAGMIEFGPNDGLFYVALGDGDGTGDPNRTAQNLSLLLGKLLRIDVDGTSPGRPYGIPAGNLTGEGVRPEIWSYGLRNPWRFSFDRCNGDLYIGDVGQAQVEEIDYEPGNAQGRNYGWSNVEGNQCFATRPPCDMTGYQTPVLTYRHTEGCSVTSGYVYRGTRIPGLRGTYFYADYCSGRIGSFRMRDGMLTDLTDQTMDLNPDGLTGINSFGVDNAGEIYVVTTGGTIFRIDAE